MVRQLLHFNFVILFAASSTGSPNKLILYLKELEVSAVKSAIALASGGSSRFY